ncbi:hypothetical protein EJ04DRAFT_562488 [Polyplosphaeria fusca]|uniref:Uncharacterized protein n=1 Tax=Polyplosphaeria fusca TaxID=682080 RepID=A0A9P4V4P7_9PLEO|nr:hypothetical protein EJ04DRAFT_562488 [Polyplosphaeria fusca]
MSITQAPTHAPIPTTSPIPDFPAEFADIPNTILDCWRSHGNYTIVSEFLEYEVIRSASWITSKLPPSEWITSTDIFPGGNCQTTPISLTTLCDGFPRASTYLVNCESDLVTSYYTTTWIQSYITPTWATEISNLPSPTCKVASDYSPECTRLNDAMSWWQAHPTPTSFVLPGCKILQPPKTTPACSMTAATYNIYSWPTPAPSGADFCSQNASHVTGTPTIPGKANTAVVSGHTLTSPSIYHFLSNITLRTALGDAYYVGSGGTSRAWNISTTILDKPLTVAQRESDILSMYRRCGGSGAHKQCVYYFKTDFRLNDVRTVRVDNANCKYCLDGTVYQDEYRPTIGVPVQSIVEQNGVFGDCGAWLGDIKPSFRVTDGPRVVSFEGFGPRDLHAITSEGGVAAPTEGGRSGVVTATSVATFS